MAGLCIKKGPFSVLTYKKKHTKQQKYKKALDKENFLIFNNYNNKIKSKKKKTEKIKQIPFFL